VDRRRFLLASMAGALVGPLSLEAQPPSKVAKIGLLTPSSPAGSGHLVEALLSLPESSCVGRRT
jgi:hypothetical protein